MKPSQHVVISAGCAAILGVIYKSWMGFWVCFLSGVFIDIDHIFDFFLHHKRLPKKYEELSRYCEEQMPQKYYCFFHSYELIVTCWAISFVINNTFMWSLTIGISIHMICDVIYNPLKPAAYLLAMRIFHKFDGKKLFVK